MSSSNTGSRTNPVGIRTGRVEIRTGGPGSALEVPMIDIRNLLVFISGC